MASITVRTIHTKLQLATGQEAFQSTIDTLGSHVTVKTNLGSSTVALTLAEAKTLLGLDEQESQRLEDFGQEASNFDANQMGGREQELALLAQKDAVRDATIYSAARSLIFEQYKNVPLNQLAQLSGMQDEVAALQMGNGGGLSLQRILSTAPKGVNLLQPIRETKALSAGN